MRQVPYYALIGNGRLASHLRHYFTLLNIPFNHWYRQLDTPLASVIKPASHVLLLINDNAIDAFIRQHPKLQEKILIHCSGALHSELAYSAHPLQTFNNKKYSLTEYQRIPFIIETEGPAFNHLFPTLPNTHYAISKKNKPLYHCLCVMANNFTTLLWQHTFDQFIQQLNIPISALQPYLEQTLTNLINEPHLSLTGPLQRNDTITLDHNMQSLEGSPYQPVYQAFVNAYQQEK